MTSERLAAIDASMTAGPWQVTPCPPTHYPGLADVQTVPPVEHGYPACAKESDAEGIAELRNALPALVALVAAAENIKALDEIPSPITEDRAGLYRRAWSAHLAALAALDEALA